MTLFTPHTYLIGALAARLGNLREGSLDVAIGWEIYAGSLFLVANASSAEA